ncbi:MAG: PorV/PorQ family protein [Gemmatimonadetes bacterium]|uniref:PorV/PorQ family protein n=1 Tax=Candidatus Kutchimonas denitrificans TaxID=3056748 RepID=A0AAE5CAL9_9BACT|nr:PorV/PorQ family protein [Gemmatimonadota bacterium]NIR74732.1 PorV/PorQ family protein [Candidatus Kutchimonas denitrificans]NIS01482.1 PorV/PorQ family protein [Gemmatimonadota bacterium]NIT67223.1 PorV/PorQ family protein [Gemmatimonadota bacterium]NIV24006.1 PorV/PorQ family protein [Gemmatimonadota bacterium]
MTRPRRKGVPRVVAGLALTLLVCPPGATGQGFEDEAAFLTAPMGARIVGIGRAAVSIRGEVQGTPWNPATLAGINSVEPLASHYDGPLDFKFNYLAVAVPAGKVGVFSFAANVQSFGEISISDGLGTTLGTVTPGNLIVTLSYGREILPRFALGVSGKWIRSELSGDLTGDTYAFDAGLLWRPWRAAPLDLGASLVNLGPDLRMGDGPNAGGSPLPGRLRFGASYDLLEHLVRPDGSLGLLIAVDVEHALRDLGTGSQFVGAELGIAGVLFLRGGYIAETLIETNSGATLGLGLAIGPARFDLARELGVNQLGDETHISLTARL